MPTLAARTMLLASALVLATPAAARQPPIGTLTFSQTTFGPLALSSYTFGLSNPTVDSTGGSGAGKVTFSDFTVVRSVDAASPALMLLAAQGRHVQSVVISVANGDTPVTYTLEDVTVTSLRQSGATETTETLTLAFQRITMTVGGSSATWDLATNTSV